MFVHLKNEKMNYSTHFFRAFHISWLCLKASYYLFIHAIYPDVYEYDGSKLIEKIYLECKNSK